MIARLWRGWVATSDADAYVRYVAATGIAAYRSTPGNLGASLLRRDLPDGRTEIVTLSYWTSMDAVTAFAGPDPERAVFYPEDDRYLVERETTVTHFEVPVYASDGSVSAAHASPVRELRLALTVPEFDRAVTFYRDVLGLPAIEQWDNPTGRGAVLDAGRATLELLDPAQTAHVDAIEVGREGVSGDVRVALEVADSAATAGALVAAGAERLGGPIVTPWSHRNVRLRAPDGLQMTLFTVLDG